MTGVQRGEAAAFDELVRRHDHTLRLHLLRYVGPDDVGDLRQEVLLRIWHKAGQWTGRGSPLAWLLRIATNLALNHLRARRPTVPLEGGADDEGDSRDATSLLETARGPGHDELEHREQAARVMELINEMPSAKRDVLTMSRLENMTLQTIAEKLDVPLGTVKSRLHAATQWLSARWEEDE
ncbi:MAG TPA: sigma-70 family RNA polymerase sigma factor [Armatimonadota bacterium]|nr:sigma-70 family RNA polymerase sigma factor [Armatimonadota bacterium]